MIMDNMDNATEDTPYPHGAYTAILKPHGALPLTKPVYALLSSALGHAGVSADNLLALANCDHVEITFAWKPAVVGDD